MKKTLVLTALAGAALVFAPIASASPTDDAYLSALHNHGLSSRAGDDDLVKVGHGICAERSQGLSEQAIIQQLIPTASSSVTPTDVAFLVQTAERFYCPSGPTV